MKFVKLFTDIDEKSYFQVIDSGIETKQPLGYYSKKYPATAIMFRDFEKDAFLIGIQRLNRSTLFISRVK